MNNKQLYTMKYEIRETFSKQIIAVTDFRDKADDILEESGLFLEVKNNETGEVDSTSQKYLQMRSK